MSWNPIQTSSISAVNAFNECRSPSLHFRRKRNATKPQLSDNVKIETKTIAKKINITWNINEQTLDIAKAASKGDKKGVIGAALEYDDYLFKLELCVPGWRRSQMGFSAFYLTVPKKTSKSDENGIIFEDDDDNDDSPESDNDENEFVARYTVSFGDKILQCLDGGDSLAKDNCQRISSIRNDFDLGVGFPNFTEVTTLLSSITAGVLVFKIEVEIFSCDSTVRADPEFCTQKQSAEHTVSKLLANMYYKKLNCDAEIIAERKRIAVHKCVLNSASSVFHAFFSHASKENVTGTIVLNFPADIVQCMVGFLYRGVIDFDDSARLVFDDDCDVMSTVTDERENGEKREKRGLDDEDNDVEDERKDTDEIKAIDDSKYSFLLDDLESEHFDCPTNIKKLLQLFQIAECYEINDLLIACCHKLYSYLSIKTSCIFLIYLDKFAHVSETKRIRDSIWDFISQNIKQIKMTNGYYYLLRQKPVLLDQLIDKIMQ